MQNRYPMPEVVWHFQPTDNICTVLLIGEDRVYEYRDVPVERLTNAQTGAVFYRLYVPCEKEYGDRIVSVLDERRLES